MTNYFLNALRGRFHAKYLVGTARERAAPDRAGARPYRLQWRITSLIACESGSGRDALLVRSGVGRLHAIFASARPFICS